MSLYHPHAIDPRLGGYFQNFRDDGTVFDPGFRHLVSSTRMVFNYAMAALYLAGDDAPTAREDYLEAARHGLRYLEEAHWRPELEGYAWTLRDNEPVETIHQNYGLAFVVLAHAAALRAGIQEARKGLEKASRIMERRFWLPDHGLYADDAAPDWTVSDYRGQNSNMHACEAMIAAYEATGESFYIDRARALAANMTVRQAEKTGGLIWEHYHDDWSVDWDYNRDNPKHLFRPWGFQAGHQTEWAKLLVILADHCREDWMIGRAVELFDRTMPVAWDGTHGGIVYGFAPDHEVSDGDKYFWVQAESLAAAALLARSTGRERYWRWYDRIWEYSWNTMIDHRYGGWHRVLTQQGRPYSDEKSIAGGKCDYHTMGACYDVLKRGFKDGGAIGPPSGPSFGAPPSRPLG